VEGFAAALPSGFVVRMANGSTLILEINGEVIRDFAEQLERGAVDPAAA